MFHRLREPFGKAGLIVAALALVFAMLGGAYAAENSGGDASASAKNKRNAKKGKQGGLNAKQKRQVIALAKRFAGKDGPQGPQGIPGAPGADGQNGSNGSNGSDGADGSDGTNGKSVVLGTATAAQCPDGGKTVEVEGSGVKNPVCNGAEGPEGALGTAGTTLPEDATETGIWSVMGEGFQAATFSFAVPLAAPLDASHVHYQTEVNFADFDGGGAGTEGCTGSVAAPTAPSGHLCVYGASESEIAISLDIKNPATAAKGAATSGAHKYFVGETGFAQAFGTWAVTG